MSGHAYSNELEIQSLKDYLLDKFEEIHPSESGLNTSNQCFQITVSPQDEHHPSTTAVQLGFIFSLTENYPDEVPLLNVKSIRGIQTSDLKILKEKLEQQALENLGRNTIFTLANSAKNWLIEKFAPIDVRLVRMMEDFNAMSSSPEPNTEETPETDFFSCSSTSDDNNQREAIIRSHLHFLNTASREELRTVKLIGKKRVSYIMALREESPQPFKTLNDLEKIGLYNKEIKIMMRSVGGGLFD